MDGEAVTTYAKRILAKPEDTDIARCADFYSELLSGQREVMLDADAFYGQYYKVWKNPHTGKEFDRPYYYTPKTRSIIDQAADTQFSYAPKVHRNHEWDRREDASRLASELETWGQNALTATSLREAIPVFKQFVKDLCMYGKGVLEGPRFVMFPEMDEPEREPNEDDDEFDLRMAAWEADRKNWNPLRIKCPHPSKVLMDPWEKQPEEAVLRKQMYAHQVEALTLKKQAIGREVDPYDASGGRYKVIDIEEYWTKHWHAVKLKGGQMLFVERNRMGFMPYQQAYSGYGWRRTDDEDDDPRYLCAGLYEGNWDALRARDQQASTRQNMLTRKGWASRVTKATDAKAVEALNKAARGDDIIGIDPDDIGVLEYPDVTGDLYTESGHIDHDLEEGTFSRAIAGGKLPGVDTVGQQAILSQAAARKFDVISNNQAEGATIILENALRLVDRYGEDVTIRGTTIGREHIHRVYSVEVSYPNVDPVLKMQEREMAMQEVREGIISKETYREDARGMENEEQERQRILEQHVYEDPSVLQQMAQAVAEEIGAPIPQTEQPAGGQGGAPMPSGLLGPDGQPIRPQNPGQVANRQVSDAAVTP